MLKSQKLKSKIADFQNADAWSCATAFSSEISKDA